MKKKIILVLVIFILIFMFSFFYKKDKKINYTLIGEKQVFSNNIISKNFSDLIYEKLNKKYKVNYNKDFIKDDIRLVDIINIIKENKRKNNKTIQKVLKDSNIIILYAGASELYYKLSKEEENNKEIYLYMNETLKDYTNLLNKIKNYNDNIIVLGIYDEKCIKNNKKYYDYFNNKLKKICKKLNMNYIDTYKNDDYLTKTNKSFITNKGNLTLFYKIYSKINKFYLHKTL